VKNVLKNTVRKELSRAVFTDLKFLLRTSATQDTVEGRVIIALTIQGKRRAIPKNNKPMDLTSFLKKAMFEGLKNDGFPKAEAQMILHARTTFFVTKCPICRPIEKGVKQYIDNYQEQQNKAPNDLLLGLSKDNREDQQVAFSQLVNRYIERYFKTSHLSADMISKLRQELLAGRKKGMGLKSDNFGSFCPSCDGACGLKKE